VAFETVLDGLCRACDRAAEQLDLSTELICCFLRHLSADEAMATLTQAAAHRDRIVGVGLDSSEKGHPPSKFTAVFDEARRLGFRAVAHAGEEGPPAYITEALDLLKVERIDHGVRAVEDEQVVERLVREGVPLTVCPLSNTALKVFDRMEDHTLRRLHDAGAVVTLNSDDPAYFGGYLVDNLVAAAKALGLSFGDLATMARHSIDASFAADERKEQLRAELEAFLESTRS
jgi:adenosine deaminase